LPGNASSYTLQYLLSYPGSQSSIIQFEIIYEEEKNEEGHESDEGTARIWRNVKGIRNRWKEEKKNKFMKY
jgi:hypothetical protein